MLPRVIFRLIIPVLAVVAFAADLGASTLAVRVESDVITVLIEGPRTREQYALVFSRQSGSISGWYDLARDPDQKTNLCARGEGNGFALFQNRAEILLDKEEVAVCPGPAAEFRVAEQSDVRVVIETSGPLVRPFARVPAVDYKDRVKEVTGRDLPGPKIPGYFTRFTVYPNGRVFITHRWEFKGMPASVTSNRMLLATVPADDVVALNDHADEQDAFKLPATFVLHHGTGKGFRADAMLVSNSQKYPTDWLGQTMTLDGGRRGWMRSGFTVLLGKTSLPAGRYTWNFMLQLDLSGATTRELAKPYVDDYVFPARVSFPNERGGMSTMDQEDTNLDGYAEGTGCYVMRADVKGGVEFMVNCGQHTRFQPAFQIEAWQGDLPKVMELDDQTLHVGLDYNARIEKGVLLFQYLGTLEAGKHLFDVRKPAARAFPVFPK